MKRAFTLIELMLAVLLGAMVVVIIAGSLRASINAWEAVEKTTAVNYNRRTVLDLIKRQCSSLFYLEDAQNLNNQKPASKRKQAKKAEKRKDRQGKVNNKRGRKKDSKKEDAFQLPNGASYFKGETQLLEFVSTVSFLSDFPGQVSVKYYVVQDEGDTEQDGEPPSIGAEGPPPPEHSVEDGEDSEDVEELEGNLYLVIQETNIFMNQTGASAGIENRPEDLEEDQLDEDEEEEESDDVPLDAIFNEESEATTQVTLLGPLRRFSIRYRKPNAESRDAEEEDEEEDWETSWNVQGNSGTYPSAIEFILFYEKPGITEDVDTEELDGVRMVIPVYSSGNLDRRGSKHGDFFDDQ